ncbi:MAG: four-carbon acid sugar kinase family protein [Candidatus Bathyarchaeia archaeon]
MWKKTSLFYVIADDFTGACDVGVQFKKLGLETLILTIEVRLDKSKSDFDVLVLDTESRNVVPDIAYKKTREAIKALNKTGARLVYKKIDSTLRGNIGAEIDAVLDEMDAKAILVAPSFPALGRTVINGYLLVNNTPLEKTDFAQDPLNPVKESHVATLIKHQTRRKIGELSLSKVRSDFESLTKEIQKLIEAGKEIIVSDAETQEDLAAIAKVSAACNILPCGSAGLATEVSRLLISRLRGSSLLVVSGSVNNVTLNQIRTAEKELCVNVLEPDIFGIFLSKEKWDIAIDNLKREAEKAIVEGKDIIIRLARSKSLVSEIQMISKKRGMSKLEIRDRLLSILSECFQKIIENYRFIGLILIGGDTAARTMKVLGAEGFRIEKEILPGVPLGRILGGNHEGLRVVTKAGGFGDKYALVKIMKYLKDGEIK